MRELSGQCRFCLCTSEHAQLSRIEIKSKDFDILYNFRIKEALFRGVKFCGFDITVHTGKFFLYAINPSRRSCQNALITWCRPNTDSIENGSHHTTHKGYEIHCCWAMPLKHDRQSYLSRFVRIVGDLSCLEAALIQFQR